MVVRFLPLAAIQFARALACSTVIGVSTRTASRSPEIRVDEIGGHGRSFSPGAKSIAIAGMLGVRNTSTSAICFELYFQSWRYGCRIARESNWLGQLGLAKSRPLREQFQGHSIRTPVFKSLWPFWIAYLCSLFISNVVARAFRSDHVKRVSALSIRSGLCRHQRTVRYP